MRYVLTLLIAVGLLVLAGCTGLFPTTKTPTQLGQELVDKIVEMLNDPDFEFPDPDDSPTEFMEFALNFIYVPEEDRNDNSVISGVEWIGSWAGYNFLFPSTITEVKVLSALEHSVKFTNPNILSNPPSFVEKVYTLTLECETEDGTVTSVSLPMITVSGEDQGYFYTIFIKETDTGTTTRIYPQPPILS